jgi:hypothetical protein
VRERLDDYLNRYDTGLVLRQVVLDKTEAPDAVRMLLMMYPRRRKTKTASRKKRKRTAIQ